MNTGKGTDDISDRGKEVLTSTEAYVSVCSIIRAPGGKSVRREAFTSGPSTPLDLALNNHMVIPNQLYYSGTYSLEIVVPEVLGH